VDGGPPVSLFREYLKLAGKSRGRVAAVFGATPDHCAKAVRHLRSGAPEAPVWLFCSATPDADTAALCERVFQSDEGLALLIEAEKELWPHWVALTVSTWTGERGQWPVKMAPFLLPPFRALIMNEHGDFFDGTPAAVLRHFRERLREGFRTGARICPVFGITPAHCATAVHYVRRGAPDARIWLFTVTAPDAGVAALCDRVFVSKGTLDLLVQAQKELWPRWVALAVATWTGEHGRWPLKLAPFLIPPFRTLLMNEHGDFFAGKPGAVLRHVRHRVRNALLSTRSRAKDLGKGAWLWLFALLAQYSAPLSRWAFRKYAATGARSEIRVGPALPPVLSVDVFRHQPRHWNFQDLLAFAHASTATHILFQTTPGEADLADLFPLCRDPRTFAVSRQLDRRDWKPSLFATAPFRTLQPGEASQTLAPVSPTMLVDRQKLLALGIPKTVVPGSAWYLIFWKAAAAGWRSFSVGGSAGVPLAPDWPYEEAEFVTRVLSEPALRSLAPAEPELARGNIAFAIGRGRPVSRKSVLVVSPYLPYPLSHGGAVRIYNLCRALQGRADFLLACFREKNDTTHYDKLHEVFREVYVLDRDEKSSRDLSLPKQVREHQSASLRALIADRRPDLLQIEFTHLAHFRDAAPQTPAILVEHDLTFTLYRQFAERDPGAEARREYERWLAFERHWLTRYDAVWTMSGDDRAAAIAEGAPAARTFAVANGVDRDRFVPLPPAGDPEVFYVGSFRHLPNIIGFEKLRREVMPIVWSRFPGARLRVVAGPEPERYWRDFMRSDYPAGLDARIAMHGFVEDLRPLYAKAAVVAVPLAVSAGTNIKVMEAMACGRAVVSTSVGCAGLGLIDGEDALIRDSTEAFAGAICDLLADPAGRQAVAARARRTVEERFSWTAIANSAYDSYLELHP
jgi:glycosyltransferase involved in cell wall biosynthesis